MHRRPRSPNRLVLCMLAAAHAVTAVGQEPASSPSSDPVASEQIEVRVVNVDVTVTGPKGVAVLDLRREDFVLLEDGRPVEIAYFRGPDVAGSAPVAVESGAPAPADTAGGAEAAGPPLLAIHLDEISIGPGDRKRMLEGLEELLGTWARSGARLLLSSYRDRLEVLAGPTSDVGEILEALPADDRPSARGLEAVRDRDRAREAAIASYDACLAVPRCVPCHDNWEQMLRYMEDGALAEENRTAASAAGLADLLSTMSGVAGRKAVLYIGSGFAQRPGIDLLAWLSDVCSELRSSAAQDVEREILQYDETSRIYQLTAYANAQRVTLWTLDSEGVRATQGSDVTFTSRQFAPTARNDQILASNVQNALFLLANETGGRAFFNASDPKGALSALVGELASGYSLGFVPPHPPTNRVHILEVRLVGDAAKKRDVRYRRSYRDETVDARLASRLISALFLEPGENELAVRVGFAPSRLLQRRFHEVPVILRVPAEKLAPAALAQAGTGRSVRLWLTAAAEDSSRTDVRQEIVNLDDGKLAPSEGFYDLVVDMPLREGTQRVAVGVRDETTLLTSVVVAEVRVPVVEATGCVAGPGCAP